MGIIQFSCIGTVLRNICDSGWDFVPYGGFTNNAVQVVFVENVKFM